MDSVFNKNIAIHSRITASSFRGNDETYAPSKMIDKDQDSYWSTDDGVATASFEIDFGEEKKIDYLVLQEYIQLGQRVAAFDVFKWQDGSWEKIASETTIGYKRILPIEETRTSKLKVAITESLGCPVLSNVEVY